MPMSSRHVLATSVSQGAAALLAAAPATVHSVFARALNLEVRGELLTLADERAGRLPNGIALQAPPDLWTLGLRGGDRAEMRRHRIRIPSSGLVIDLHGASPWDPKLGMSGRRPDVGRLGPLVDLAAGSGFASRADDPWRAWGSIDALANALEAGDLAAMLGAAGTLLGRGPGLTPSGDDLLVGFSAALTVTGERAARPFAQGVAERARSRTTAVGRAYLDHAARGEYAEHLHDVLGALSGGSDIDLAAAVGRALAWGATSGADALIGIVVAVRSMDRVRPRRRR